MYPRYIIILHVLVEIHFMLFLFKIREKNNKRYNVQYMYFQYCDGVIRYILDCKLLGSHQNKALGDLWFEGLPKYQPMKKKSSKYM